MTTDRIPVILLFGPTGVGKTDLLLELFKDRGEVINGDSIQVYTDLNIGSAKPDTDYQKKIPHHLLSIVSPRDDFNVADFVKHADISVREIYSRGKIPVISGGTAFYFKNFIEGLPNLPVVEQSIRDEIQRDLDSRGLDSLYNELIGLDPEYAARVNSGDRYRVVRALEIFKQTGKSLGSFSTSKKGRPNYNFLIIGLERDRQELYKRIDLRVKQMFNMGLLNEFINLYNKGYRSHDPGMKGIGYSEFFQMKEAGCWSFDNLVEEIQRNSRRYAKRQITFFKSFSDVHWFNPGDIGSIKGLVKEFMGNNPLTIG